jgi:hypothetical protein
MLSLGLKTVGVKCWNQVAGGHMISNTGKKCEGRDARASEQ